MFFRNFVSEFSINKTNLRFCRVLRTCPGIESKISQRCLYWSQSHLVQVLSSFSIEWNESEFYRVGRINFFVLEVEKNSKRIYSKQTYHCSDKIIGIFRSHFQLTSFDHSCHHFFGRNKSVFVSVYLIKFWVW